MGNRGLTDDAARRQEPELDPSSDDFEDHIADMLTAPDPNKVIEPPIMDRAATVIPPKVADADGIKLCEYRSAKSRASAVSCESCESPFALDDAAARLTPALMVAMVLVLVAGVVLLVLPLLVPQFGRVAVLFLSALLCIVMLIVFGLLTRRKAR